MIVCVCAAVCDRAIDRAIDEGARTLPELTRRCGAGSGCGACHRVLQRKLQAARDADEAEQALLPLCAASAG